MRIRKRPVPFHLSSLSPIPLSDPHMSQSPVVQQLQLNNNNHPLQNLFPEDDTAAYFNNNQSSDQPNQPIGAATNHHHHQKESKDRPVLLLQRDEKGGGGGEGERSNDTRRTSNFLGAGKETMFVQESNSSHQALGRWGEGEKAFPLKKRRGSFERLEEETIRKEKKMKTKMNKKCLQENDNNQEQEDEKNVVNGNSPSCKKKIRGGALMEGSRCSRVNGRGWRCCQQTLVGYSLCEHHLGKGRLRSMNSVRSRSMASTATKKTISQALSSEDKELKHMLQDNKRDNGEDDQEEEGDDDDDDKTPLMTSKKKMKLGVVKARSISSLLGEANYGNNIAVVENNE